MKVDMVVYSKYMRHKMKMIWTFAMADLMYLCSVFDAKTDEVSSHMK